MEELKRRRRQVGKGRTADWKTEMMMTDRERQR